MFLEIHVVFTAGHFHGQEWPPSPARLFQAFVAATHRGAHGLMHTDVRDRALRWLEGLSAPEIVAIQTTPSRELLTNYVPNNDDGNGGDFRDHVKTAKSLRVHPLPAETQVTYRWSFAAYGEATQNADIITAIASLVTYLGRTCDLVYARGEVRDEASPVIHSGRNLLIPREIPGGRWLTPAPGFLTLCKERYPRSVSEMPPDFTNSRQVDYGAPGEFRSELSYAVLELFRHDGRRLGFDPRRLREPAGMVRHAFKRWITDRPRMAAYYGNDRISRLLLGHRNAESPDPSEGGHLGVVPLPSINTDFSADGWFRRVLVVGWGVRDATDRALFDDLTRGLDGMEMHDGGRSIGRLRTVSDSHEASLLAPWLNETAEPTRVWRSVTPIVLTGHPRRGRSLEECLARTMGQQGFSSEQIQSVAIFSGPLVPKTVAAREYRVRDYLATTRRVHTEIVFKQPITGPLILGRGRYTGFGLMMPWQGSFS